MTRYDIIPAFAHAGWAVYVDGKPVMSARTGKMRKFATRAKAQSFINAQKEA